MSNDTQQKPQRKAPLFLIKPKSMNANAIRRAEKMCGIVIAECEDPGSVRLLEPPIDADMDAQARAALSLFRYVSASTTNATTTFYGANLIKFFVDALLTSSQPSRVEKVKR